MSETIAALPELAAAGNYDALEEQWLAACESPGQDLTPFLETIRLLRERNEQGRIAVLLSLLLPNCGPDCDPRARLELLEIAAECAPDDVGVRRQLIEAIEAAYPECKGLRAFIRAAEVEHSPRPAEAMALLRKMMEFDVGRHVYHASGWGAGTVRSISPATGRLTIDFERNPGHRMPIAGAAELLEVLDDDDFRALCFARPEEAKRLAKEDPAALFASLLKARGGKATTKQVKADLLDRVVPKAEWPRWWPAAKKALRRAPMIAMTSGAAPEFTLRDKPVSALEEVLERFRAAASPAAKLEIIRETLAQPAVLRGERDAAEELTSGLIAAAAPRRSASPAQWLEAQIAAGMLREIAGLSGTPENLDPLKTLTDHEDPAALIQELSDDSLRRRAMELLRDAWPDDWPSVWARLLTTSSPALADYIMRELDASGQTEAIQAALTAVLNAPADHPEAMVWLWKRGMADKLPIAFDAAGKIGLFERMLRLLDALTAADDKARLSKVRNSLSASNYDPIEELAKAAPPEEARRLHGLVSFNRGLTENAKRTMRHILEAAHPDAFEEKLKPWEEDVTYTTEAGLEKQREELVRLTTVEYAKIARAIGEAAERGDISDNAEFRSAIEARTRLTERAAALKAAIDHAKIITPSMIPADEVSVGSRVRIRNAADGSERTVSFLGPWDTDPERDVLSYRAPFSQAFMGKRAGDVVEVEADGKTERYEILSIDRAV